MASVEFSTDQVIEIVRKMRPEGKRAVRNALACDALGGRDARMTFAEQQLRQLCAARGLDWEAMTEAERKALADELIHEDRACQE